MSLEDLHLGPSLGSGGWRKEPSDAGPAETHPPAQVRGQRASWGTSWASNSRCRLGGRCGAAGTGSVVPRAAVLAWELPAFPSASCIRSLSAWVGGTCAPAGPWTGQEDTSPTPGPGSKARSSPCLPALGPCVQRKGEPGSGWCLHVAAVSAAEETVNVRGQLGTCGQDNRKGFPRREIHADLRLRKRSRQPTLRPADGSLRRVTEVG